MMYLKTIALIALFFLDWKIAICIAIIVFPKEKWMTAYTNALADVHKNKN